MISRIHIQFIFFFIGNEQKSYTGFTWKKGELPLYNRLNIWLLKSTVRRKVILHFLKQPTSNLKIIPT